MESKRFVRSPHVVTARQVDPAIDSHETGWYVNDKTIHIIYWVSDEDFQKEYVEVPEGSEPVIFSAPARDDVPVPHETVTEKATEETYKGFLPLDAVVAPVRSPDSGRCRGKGGGAHNA